MICFFLRVQGDSMIGAGIMPATGAGKKTGACPDGDILVCASEAEATVKRLRFRRIGFIPEPANKNYPEIVLDERAEDCRQGDYRGEAYV